MSEHEIEDTFNGAEAPQDEQQEASTEAAVEEMTAAEGYPAETADGGVVRIVEKRRDGQNQEILVDADGGAWTARAHDSKLEAA